MIANSLVNWHKILTKYYLPFIQQICNDGYDRQSIVLYTVWVRAETNKMTQTSYTAL